MSWADEICEKSDLRRNACAHCRGIKSTDEEEIDDLVAMVRNLDV